MSEFQTSSINDQPVIRLPKRIDISNTQAMLDAIRGLVSKNQRRIVLDFSSTDAIDSTGLGAILYMYKSLRVGEGDLIFVAVRDNVLRALEITRLDTVFTMFPTLEQAVSGPAA